MAKLISGHQRTSIFCLAKTLLSLTPRFSGVQRWGGQVGNRFNGFPACGIESGDLIIFHVPAFLLSGLASPYLGNVRAEAAPLQVRGGKGVRLPCGKMIETVETVSVPPLSLSPR
jgi:hypothetical protein